MSDLLLSLQPAITGFAITTGLIVAIGAQNAWVLQKSLRGENPWTIASVCTLLDALLVSVGVFGLDYIQSLLPSLVPVLTWLGIALLLWLALQAFGRALQGGNSLVAAAASEPVSPWRSAGQVMALSLINPHVYLDTVVLIGSVGAQQSHPGLFVVGAACGSASWFILLVAGAKKLRPHLSSPYHWQVLDVITGVILLLVALTLLP
ncbi:LysE family transporter [Oceanobacter sp. 5_MG-2023]|uniref:LysE/ArgO family amino acid transporter n=1 Tax=Oceanobacter sp. 5_MG-2023 TaxID=3062645 RepID=UPI0026E494D1|nr:LysE family transporter [Oceanobacter sp. 5_MG-2023]MDO6681676.1 LysE family transporter [Oceanobacter sp. 5_MG-2023]